jgi:hypothetical protein
MWSLGRGIRRRNGDEAHDAQTRSASCTREARPSEEEYDAQTLSASYIAEARRVYRRPGRQRCNEVSFSLYTPEEIERFGYVGRSSPIDEERRWEGMDERNAQTRSALCNRMSRKKM